MVVRRVLALRVRRVEIDRIDLHGASKLRSVCSMYFMCTTRQLSTDERHQDERFHRPRFPLLEVAAVGTSGVAHIGNSTYEITKEDGALSPRQPRLPRGDLRPDCVDLAAI